MSILFFVAGLGLAGLGLIVLLGATGFAAMQGGIAFVAGCILLGAAGIIEAVDTGWRKIVKALAETEEDS